MKRVITSKIAEEKAVAWAIKVHSQEKDGGVDSLTLKFFLAHFLPDYTEDQSVIRLCFLHGLIPSGEIEKELAYQFSKDKDFIKDCLYLMNLKTQEMEDLERTIRNASDRQAIIIAGYIAEQFYKIEDSSREGAFIAKSQYEKRKAEYMRLVYLLPGKIPQSLFIHLEEKIQEIFSQKKELYFR